MKRLAASLLLCLTPALAPAFSTFTISDIRIDGLERISAGTVLTYLPVEKGDQMDSSRAREAVRALYRTGFFEDVQLERQGSILVVKLEERPAIAKLTLVGNKDIKEEDLRKGLTNIGLSEGEVYDRMQLDRVQQELTKQYFNRGKYNVKVRPSVKRLDRNRVEVTITISEGKASKIRHLNIVGNRTFTDAEIMEEFEAKTTNWLSWYRRDDQYSREKLSGDLEKLRNFYLDRGYVDFQVESTQVSISPDKRDIFINANISEGEVYKVGKIRLTGDFIVSEELMRAMIVTREDETFSRKKLEATTEGMNAILANLGYAFADAQAVPSVNRETRTVDLTFFVDPGRRTYVRRINFVGNVKTRDEVLRREMRQFEGGWYSKSAVDRSKIRLQKLGFFKDVKIDTPKVAGTEDQIDINVTVEERTSGSFQFGVGYSGNSGIVTSVSLTQENFLGRGNRIGIVANRNDFYNRFDVSYFNPYWTDDGISRGYTLSYRELDQGENNLASYLLDTAAASMVFSLPVSEFNRINLSLGVDRNKVTTDPGFTPLEFIQLIGDDRSFNALRSTISFASDTRDRFFVPTQGTFQRVGIELTLPGSDLEYYKLFYQYQRYFPLTEKFIFYANGELGYGDSYGGRFDDLPFFENFYNGGVRSVRGFEENTLGPRLQTGSGLLPVGGAFNVLGNFELIFPTPFAKDTESVRLSAFVDAGNVFRGISDFEPGELRYSAGLSLQWQAPVGPITINLAWPLNSKEGDERDGPLQFSFGNQF